MSDTLRTNLTDALGLPPDAVEFLMGIWALIQVFDDAEDGDPAKPAELDAAVWFAFVGMGSNLFFIQNAPALVPVMAVQVLKWRASTTAERAGNVSEKSFMWRAGFYDLILTVCCLCHGREWAGAQAHTILGMYGETLDEYLKEFAHA